MAEAVVENTIITTEKAADSPPTAAAKYSVRQFNENTWGGFIGDALGFLWGMPEDMLPSWGSYECDVALRVLHYTQHNALWGGASKIWIQKLLGTPYEISGGRNLTYDWQDIFFESDFGEGYDFMMSKFLLDYLTLNRGGFLEKVSYGEPDTPIADGARILGLNHLDALRITFTGNREWPYLYQSEVNGALHRLHRTRVVHLADQPSSNTRMFGMGKSALYDALTVANSQILLGRHQNEMLSDLPPPGIVIFNNVKADEVDTAMKQFDYERVRDGQNVYRAPLKLSSKDPNLPASVTFVPLSMVPENFDYEKYMTVHVNLLALTLQLDPQDIWPLQARSMGSGMQSNILEQKSSNKGPGYLLTRLERSWNQVLPRALEWKYKAPNAQADMQIATVAKTWTDIANTATFMNSDEKRQLIANQVPAFGDVLLDEQGQVRLYDADPKTPEQIIVATDNAQLTTPAAPPDAAAPAPPPQPAPDAAAPDATPVTKAIDDTTQAFVNEMKAAMQDGVDRTITKSGCAARIRGAIVRYGKKAYQDGLEEGGVDPDALDEDDLRVIADDNVWDSQYVTNLVNEIYGEGGLKGSVDYRASLWVSTLNRFYYDGLASADKNGMYGFVGDDGGESCRTCQRLKGQIHRLKDWKRKKLRPGIDHESFECGTWPGNCNHSLKRMPGAKAKGNW